MKIIMTSVFVHDPLEAHAFYTEVLGFTTRMYMPEMYLAIVASPEDADGVGLLLEPNNNPIASTCQRGLYDAGIPCIVFGVADLAAEHARLMAHSVVFRREPTRGEDGFSAVFEDTCGNLIQIYEG